MLGVPINVQNTKLVDYLVASEHLDRNDRGVLHQVADNLAVEDLEGSVITGIGEERQAAVILDGSDGFGVESHGLVWASREIQIMPQQSSVV